MSKPTKTKTIHVEIRTWWDKVNGNPYFAAKVYINSEDVGLIPFGYGDSAQAINEAGFLLASKGRFPTGIVNLARYCRENGISFSQSTKQELKRHVVAFGKGEL